MKADALVCVTDSDELNMIICGIAESLNPDLLKIARVRNDEYAKIGLSSERITGERILGIDHFAHPDVAAAQSILNAIGHGAMGEVLSFSGTNFQLGSVEIEPGSALDGLALKDFRMLARGDSLITLVDREGSSFLPSGATVLRHGDRAHIFAREVDMPEMFALAGETKRKLLKIGIVGGGRVSVLVAEGLLEADKDESAHGGSKNASPSSAPPPKKKPSASGFFDFFKKITEIKKIKDLNIVKNVRNLRKPKKIVPKSRSVVLIEQDYARCKELSARFPSALVLNEDISDESFVTEEELNDLDLVITVTDSQELNIVAAAYLKSRGVERAIALVSGTGYVTIARQLGVDVVVPLKQVVVDSILSHLRGGGVRGVHRIGDGSVGILEIEIASTALVAGKPITAFHLSGGGLLMLVNRNGASFIPHGDYMFRAGDHIIVIAKNEDSAELGKFFGCI
jgi:trk system potassium uptake protein TrkA